jgi:hypothetical protein
MAEGWNPVIKGNTVAPRALVLIKARRENLQGSDISVSLLFRTRRIVKKSAIARREIITTPRFGKDALRLRGFILGKRELAFGPRARYEDRGNAEVFDGRCGTQGIG